MIENDNVQVYTTLRSIEERKMQLLKEIRKDNNQINKLRKQLFAKPTALTSRKNRMSVQGLMSTGAGVFDGLLLAWKLYRKFKK
ncbi:MAG: hypothetical protein IKH99_02740 [Prevotella sp.]|jgi:uncharacterized protein YlxW (UPF0749 family)|nr:hypothetical protein [Prevotella sp.]